MVAIASVDDLQVFASTRIQRLALTFDFTMEATPFGILENVDGSTLAAIEVKEVSNSSSTDLKLTVLLWMGAGLFALMIGGFWTIYSTLNTSIENQRIAIKQDFDGLSGKMDGQTNAVGEMRAEVGKLSGEIIKAKGEMIQEISKLGVRQAVLEQTGKPLPKN